jgi:uridine phosphorylase
MPFPNFADKHAHDAVFSPEDAVADFAASNRTPLPEGVIITYQPWLVNHLREIDAELRTGFPPPWRAMWRVVKAGYKPVGVINGFGIGSPAAVMVVEELIALGVKRVINMGTAGCLQPGLGFGEIVLCNAAVRDDGVSHHYLAGEKFAYPSTELTDALGDELARRKLKFERGASWSTDAIFRETIAEARSYQAEGIVTVEMEAAALFTVGQYRGIDVAAAFMVSDHVLPDTPWATGFHSDAVNQSSVALLEASIEVLGGPAGAGQLNEPGEWASTPTPEPSSFDC